MNTQHSESQTTPSQHSRKAIYRFSTSDSAVRFLDDPSLPLDADSVDICILILEFPSPPFRSSSSPKTPSSENGALWIWAGAKAAATKDKHLAQLKTLSIAYPEHKPSLPLSATIISTTPEDNEKEIAKRLAKRFSRPITLSTDIRVLSYNSSPSLPQSPPSSSSSLSGSRQPKHSSFAAEQCIIAEILKL